MAQLSPSLLTYFINKYFRCINDKNSWLCFFYKSRFSGVFLLFTANVRSRPPGPPAVPGVFKQITFKFFLGEYMQRPAFGHSHLGHPLLKRSELYEKLSNAVDYQRRTNILGLQPYFNPCQRFLHAHGVNQNGVM